MVLKNVGIVLPHIIKANDEAQEVGADCVLHIKVACLTITLENPAGDLTFATVGKDTQLKSDSVKESLSESSSIMKAMGRRGLRARREQKK
jgi:hypothetical protein